MMLSTLRIISAASEALSSTWRFTWKDSVMPRSAMSPTVPSSMSARGTPPQSYFIIFERSEEGGGAWAHSLSPWVVLFSWCAALSWATRSALS